MMEYSQKYQKMHKKVKNWEDFKKKTTKMPIFADICLIENQTMVYNEDLIDERLIRF